MVIISGAVNRLLKPLNLKLSRAGSNPSLHAGFIAAEPIVRQAKERGISVSDLIALHLYPTSHGSRDSVVSQLAAYFSSAKSICEIGPGTGTYLDPIMRGSKARWEIYETAADWRAWLVQTYGITARETDGTTLSGTADKSQDFIHAHGVFIYLPHVLVATYFAEMVRVCAPGGHIAFDYFALEDFSGEVVGRWLATEHRFPITYSRSWIEGFFTQRGFELVKRFTKPYYASNTEYVVYKRQ